MYNNDHDIGLLCKPIYKIDINNKIKKLLNNITNIENIKQLIQGEINLIRKIKII